MTVYEKLHYRTRKEILEHLGRQAIATRRNLITLMEFHTLTRKYRELLEALVKEAEEAGSYYYKNMSNSEMGNLLDYTTVYITARGLDYIGSWGKELVEDETT